MTVFAGLIIGIVMLIIGGGFLVRGASEIADGFGVSPMIVGLTIVGFGTSAPELVVNIVGAINGATGIAFGNVIGSNISNLALVLGAAAIMSPIVIEGDVVRRELPLLLLATTMMTVMALDGPLEGRPATFGRTDVVILMLMFCIFIYITVLDLMRVHRKDALITEMNAHPAVVAPRQGQYRWLYVLGGLVLLLVGGQLTIRNGVAFAGILGVSTSIIGLFVVAVGTSMPELVTSVIAAIRKESDLALGNVIGSNIFNSLMVLPASGVIATISVPEGGVTDLLFSWLLAACLIPLFLFGKALLNRVTGAILISVYIGYAALRIADI